MQTLPQGTMPNWRQDSMDGIKIKSNIVVDQHTEKLAGFVPLKENQARKN